MVRSKYLATAIALLFLFSGLPLAATAALPSGVESGASVGLHGPYLNSIKFTVITSDATLLSSLTSNTIQGPEWYFAVGSYITASQNTNLYTNYTTGYTFDVVAFNMLHAVINNTHFRLAIQDLTDYSYIQGTVLSGIGGSAQPDMLPCAIYPDACNSAAFSSVTHSQANAMTELLAAGLVCNGGGACGAPGTGAGRANVWTYNGAVFSPLYYYRSDDPLRSGVATNLVFNAQSIGLQLNAKGIIKAGGPVYLASVGCSISAGTYNPVTGGNNPPQFDYKCANSGSDAWDMYSAGWITSPIYNWPWFFFNSANVLNTENFLNFYNATMDKDTNSLYYATSWSAAQTAAQKVGLDFAQQNPYVMSFYQNQLYSVYLKGWTGYDAYTSTGPMTSYGVYYSFLNLHPTGQATGGTYNYALHQIADDSGMDPLYGTNWVWQVDVWGEIYDSQLAFSPTQPTTAEAFVPWEGSYSVNAFSGSISSGSGYTLWQPSLATGAQKVVGQAITFNLYNNMTFSDHVPVTAYDLNYSLDAFNVVGNLPDSTVYSTGALAGSAGLIATYIPPNNPFQITYYINSTSVWNAGNVVWPVLPLHIFKYFSADRLSGSAALETTDTFAAAVAACAGVQGTSCMADGGTGSNAPAWLQDLPNLEIGNGPFTMQSFDPTTGTGQLLKNVNYYRSAWWAGAPSVAAGASFTYHTMINESMFNSGSSSMMGVGAGATGTVPITNATGTVTVEQNGTPVGTPVTLTAGSGGAYSASIPTSGLSAGLYELVVNASYNFLGLHRTWLQFGGMQVSGAMHSTTSSTTQQQSTTSSTTQQQSTTSSTTTSSSTDYTPYIAGIVVILVIIVIAVALARRRGGGGT